MLKKCKDDDNGNEAHDAGDNDGEGDVDDEILCLLFRNGGLL